MREAELDLLLENFRAIADERMADLVITPDMKQNILRAAKEAPQQAKKVIAFPKRRVVWGSVAVAAALLVAAIGGARLLGGMGSGSTQQEIAAAEGNSPSLTYQFDERATESAPETPVGTLAVPEEGASGFAEPPPAPDAVPAPSAGDDAADTKQDGDRGYEKSGGENGIASVEEESEEETTEEMEIADGFSDPEADGMPDFCLLATAPEESVSAVFTGEVISTQVLSISLKDGSTILLENALPPQPSPDQPVMEDDALSDVAAPVYGIAAGDRMYVVVTSYRVEQVHAGEMNAPVVRVLGTGTAGSLELVAVAAVRNALENGVEIRYDLVADYAAVLTDADLSAANIARIAGMYLGD